MTTSEWPRVHMTGSEWFASRTGGLNRYFESLFVAMHHLGDDAVTASAFGVPPPGGTSWGPVGSSLLKRATALLPISGLSTNSVIDRHFCLYGPPVGLSARRPRTVVHFQGPWFEESRVAGQGQMKVAMKHVFERMRYARADHFVVLCQRFAELLSHHYNIDADRISVLAPGVDLARFNVVPSSESRNVLCVRRLERRMGIDQLIAAWPSVVDLHPDATLTIVGTGTAEGWLRECAATSAAAESIEFTGPVNDAALVDLYGRSACTVVPSTELEGFGLIALESLAVGRAPIVTDCGGLPDAVVDVDSTLIVPPKRPELLAHRIADALDGNVPSPAQCRSHAETFGWQLVAQRHRDLYESLL